MQTKLTERLKANNFVNIVEEFIAQQKIANFLNNFKNCDRIQFFMIPSKEKTSKKTFFEP